MIERIIKIMKAKEISRNDYYKMLRKTGVIPNDDEYKIKDLDLSAYHLTETTQRITNVNFMEESVNRNGEYMLRGHWFNDLCYQFAEKCNFNLVQIDGYSSYAYSDDQMAIFTYCEGDITLTPYINKDSYEKEKERTIKFYEEGY